MVTLINIGNYAVDEELTPNENINNFNYFIPVMEWRYFPIVAKAFSKIESTLATYEPSVGCYVLRCCIFTITNTGKIKITSAAQCNMNQDGTFGSFEWDKYNGYGLIGIKV